MRIKKSFVRKGDQVLILSGKDKGRRGKVVTVAPRLDRVIVEGINIAKKHARPTQKAPQGGIVEMPAPIHISNCMVVCPRCEKPIRVKRASKNEGKGRRCRRCGENIDV